MKKADILVLLIGENPMPNAVSAKLLVEQEGKTILLFSKKVKQIAERLDAFFRKYKCPYPAEKCQVDESNPWDIQHKLTKLLSKSEDNSSLRLGLNYTGGTKPMAVHAYQAIKKWSENRRNEVFYTYLDPRKMRMIIHHDDLTTPPSYHSVIDEFDFMFEDMMELHRWTLKDPVNEDPVLPETANLIAKEVCAETNDWKTWIEEEFYIKIFKLPDEKWDEKKAHVLKNILYRKKKNKNKLKKITIDLGTRSEKLKEIETQLKFETGYTKKDMMTIGDIFELTTIPNVNDAVKWIDGCWLESLVLQSLKELCKKLNLHDVCMNIKPKLTEDTDFEFDVIAIRGYQLFAFSCTTADRKFLNKPKLFECFIRAHQMGGDEACLALVSCDPEPMRIERELEGALPLGSRIKVFGKPDLLQLKDRISEWIKLNSSGEITQ